MHITVKNSDFSRELNLLEKVVGKKPTISVLANVLITANMGGLLLSATDLEIGLMGACAADVHEPGAVTLPARKLMEIVRAQSDGALTLKEDTRGAVKFTSGKFTSRLQSLPARDFPGIPSIEGHPSLVLPRNGLKAGITQIRYAISDKDSRYYTQGAYLAFADNGLTMVSTDSARLAITQLARTGAARDAVLVPSKCLDELLVLLGEPGDSDVTFAQSERHLFFDLDGRVLISRQVDGKFPAYERIIPKHNEHKAMIARQEFVLILRRLVLINDVVALSFKEHTLDASAVSVEVGDGAEHMVIDYAGPELLMRFRGEFLLDFLNAASSDNIVIAMRDTASPIILMDGGYQNVLMGMRI